MFSEKSSVIPWHSFNARVVSALKLFDAISPCNILSNFSSFLICSSSRHSNTNGRPDADAELAVVLAPMITMLFISWHSSTVKASKFSSDASAIRQKMVC
ncbi:hypothetical protein V6N13_100480 [Hibiscus sabdariffa]|uniref:Uncharacterized protein n=1 Tax=Hibiscus sabdariffa TaxID=183260 RepID=A0ABR2PCS2_9ROSI